MTADVENGVEFCDPRQDIGQLLSVGPERLVLVQKLDGKRVAFEHLDRARVERRFAAIGRRDNQLNLVFQDGIWMGKFRLLACQRRTLPSFAVRLTKNHPVGSLLAGTLPWEVRTIKTLGAMVVGAPDPRDNSLALTTRNSLDDTTTRDLISLRMR